MMKNVHPAMMQFSFVLVLGLAFLAGPSSGSKLESPLLRRNRLTVAARREPKQILQSAGLRPGLDVPDHSHKNASALLQLAGGLRRAGRKPRGKQIEAGEEYEPSERDILHRKNWPWWVRPLGTVFFLILFSWLVSCISMLLWRLHCEFQAVNDYKREEVEADEDTERQTYYRYLKYRFAYWFVWTKGANMKILAGITVFSCLLGAILYAFNTGTNMWSSLWLVFVWLVAPDAGGAETTAIGAAHGATMSIVGLVLFALMLTLTQDSFNKYLAGLRTGAEPVLESGHTLLIGLTESTMPVIQELCKAYETSGGTVLCVLSSMAKVDMEQMIRDKGYDMYGSRVVVREGYAQVAADLAHVAAESAKSIIIMPDRDQPKEMRDSFVLRVMIALRGRGWPTRGRLVAVCSLVRNMTLFSEIGGPTTDVVMLDVFLGKLMVQCSQHLGLGTIVKNIFGFDGSEFYLRPVPEHMAGKTFAEASLFYSSAVLCGVMIDGGEESITSARNGGGLPSENRRTQRNFDCAVERWGDGGSSRFVCDLCPGKDYCLQKNDEVVLLALDAISTEPELQRCDIRQGSIEHLARTQKSTSQRNEQRAPEQVLIMGWNDHTGFIILELDSVLPSRSEIIIVSSKPREEREKEIVISQKRWNRTLENVETIQHVEGTLGSRFLLEELPVKVYEVSRIFILADESAEGPVKADTVTIGVLVQIRDVLTGHAQRSGSSDREVQLPSLMIVPEIQDPETESDCATIQASDFIDTSGLPSQVLSMIAYQPRVAYILDDLLTESGRVSFEIRKLQDYIQPGTDPPTCVNFFQVQELAGHQGDVVVGWSAPRKSAKEAGTKADIAQRMCIASDFQVQDWEMNPQDKMRTRGWSAQQDKLVVLCVCRH